MRGVFRPRFNYPVSRKLRVPLPLFLSPMATGASFLNAQEKVNRNVWNSATTDDDINIGQWGVIILVTDNETFANGASTLHVSITIGSTSLTKAHEYSASQGGIDTGSAVSVWYFKASSFIASGSVVAVTLNIGRTAKAITGYRFDINSSYIISGVDGITNEPIVGSDPGSISATGSKNAWHYWVRAIGMEWPTDTLGQLTKTADWLEINGNGTTGNPNASNQSVRAEYNIKLGANSGATDPSLSTTSDGASILVGLAIEQASTGSSAGSSTAPALSGSIGSSAGSSTVSAVSLSGSIGSSAGSSTVSAVSFQISQPIEFVSHVVWIGSFSVDAVGNVFNKNDQNVTVRHLLGSSTEQRIIVNNLIPNTVGNPTVKNYLKLEADDNFVVSYFDSNMIITNLINS